MLKHRVILASFCHFPLSIPWKVNPKSRISRQNHSQIREKKLCVETEVYIEPVNWWKTSTSKISCYSPFNINIFQGIPLLFRELWEESKLIDQLAPPGAPRESHLLSKPVLAQRQRECKKERKPLVFIVIQCAIFT